MAMARYDIFREQLASEYPEYGHALWEPNPRRADRPVQVGDVGFVLKGKFQRLFNALLPADDPSHDLGVPEYHEQLVPNLPDHIDNRFLNPQHYCSAGITVEIEPDLHAGPEDFPRVSFSYSGRRGGAVLSLPLTARREDTLAQRDFGKWIVKHIDRCFAFAQRYGLEIERMEDIVLVTGCDRARSWTNVAFSGGQAGAQVSFGIEVLNGADVPNTSVNFQFLPEHVRGAVVNQGPEGRDLPENQCVFIRGFRVARPLGFLPKQLKAAAEPTPDDYDLSKYRDPLHLLVNYIAERASDCDMVLVHDDDLKRIDGLGGGTSSDVLQPDMMMNILRKSNLDIYKARFSEIPASTEYLF
ncbi:hypothetical protein BC826DRAFT_970466 [Russula brevipes]|nr:hypothetical protein BC826DRAFT_970466 [Russula brevipes]